MEKILSIIIPTYNMESLLPRCLDSLIINKNLEKLEVWVVNDGSKDRSSVIGHQYEERYPGVINVIDKPNGNYGSCINVALPKCTGKYVKILDSDDFFYTQNLEQFIDDLQNTNVDLVATNVMDINDVSGTRTLRLLNMPDNKDMTFEDVIHYECFKNIQMHFVTYKTSLFSQFAYNQTEKISYTDQEWIFKPMVYVNSLRYMPFEIYCYLIGREGQTMDPMVFIKNISHQIKSQESRIKFYEDNKSSISKSHKDYLLAKITHSIEFIYKSFLVRDYNLDVKLLLEYDRNLKNISEELYEISGRFTIHKTIPYFYVSNWRNNGITKIPTWIRIRMKLAHLLSRKS